MSYYKFDYRPQLLITSTIDRNAFAMYWIVKSPFSNENYNINSIIYDIIGENST